MNRQVTKRVARSAAPSRRSKQLRGKAKHLNGKRPKSRTSRTDIIRREPPTVSQVIENVLIQGDLTPLSSEQRLEYYRAVCKSLGLNPLTRPFSYIAFRETENAPAKLVLYALKDCTEQLRKIHGIAVTESASKTEGDMLIVSVKTMDKHGRTDAATGVVSLSDKFGKNLTGKHLANAIMRAETKAKRRATLSLAGLGFLDESELDGLDNYGTLTPGGRVMFEKQAPPANLEAAVEAADKQNPYLRSYEEKEREALAKLPAPCLWYMLHPESQTYEITGDQALKEKNRDLLLPLWNAGAGTIVATPEQLGKLISRFEAAKVPFRELKRPG